jgi:hypothetical protein
VDTPHRQQRAARRVLAALEAGYEDRRRQIFLRTRDLSESGIYLLSHDPPDVGSLAEIHLELPGCPAILRLRGTVIRRETGGTSGFALLFDEGSNESALGQLRQYVQQVASDDAQGAADEG